MSFCPKCGNKLEANSKFCSQCGAKCKSKSKLFALVMLLLILFLIIAAIAGAIAADIFLADGKFTGIDKSLISDSGTFTDYRDGKTYRYVEIGTQTWMAENLNYDISGSKCYSNSPAMCAAYGRLYSWALAKAVCPAGWRLPSSIDWRILENNAPGPPKKLRAAFGWNKDDACKCTDSSPNGADYYGFAALPGGYSNFLSGEFYSAGFCGFWWSSGSAKDYYSENVYTQGQYCSPSAVFSENSLFSVRCVKDY